MSNEKSEKLNQVVTDIGHFIEYWGFRKIHGKVWGLVYLSETPISTPDIVERLGVSKALVSGAINELLKYELIERVGQVKHGGITYRSSNDLAQVVKNVIRQRELVLLSKIEENLKDLSKLKVDEKKSLNISTKKTTDLRVLTTNHKKIAKKISSLKVKSLDDWIRYIKAVTRFL